MAAASVDSFQDHLLKGGEHLRCGRIKDAVVDLHEALELRDDDPQALGLMGLAHFRLSDFKSARPVYEKLVSVDPGDASNHLNLGLVYLKLGDAANAITHLKKARTLDPGEIKTVSYLGLAHASQGEYAEAYEAFLMSRQNQLAEEMAPHVPEEARKAIDAKIGEGKDISQVTALPSGPEPAAESQREVAPPASPEESSEESSDEALSEAVSRALPSSAMEKKAVGAALGHQPPTLLADFVAAKMIRPDEVEHSFELTSTGLLSVRVKGRIMAQTAGIIVSGGQLAFEPASRRVRGANIDEIFGDERPLFIVSGDGHLVVAPNGERFTALNLDDDILYLREELIYGFDEELRWENGFVPGSESTIRVVQFRGDGSVALRTPREVIAIKIASDRIVYVDQAVLAGWIGRVIPQFVQPAAGGESSTPFIECSGEGIVLVQGAEPGAGV